MLTKHTLSAIKLAALLFCSQSALATSFSYTGNFNNDNDVQLFNFSIAADSSSLSINTFSLNGGINAAGTSIAAGGFNPYLAIFNQLDHAWVFDTTGKAPGTEASITGYGTLLAGDYILALTQYDNIAVGSFLDNGFADSLGLASFEPIPFTTQGGGGGNHWALDITLADTASVVTNNVPTPEALSLTLMGLMGFGLKTRRKIGIFA
jgi:hypothetical protein